MERFMNEIMNKFLERTLENMERFNNATEAEQEALMQDASEYLDSLLRNFRVRDSDLITTEIVFLVKKDTDGKEKIVLDSQESINALMMALQPSEEEMGEEFMFDEHDHDHDFEFDEEIVAVETN
jgi:predicted nucleic acid-binding protein